MPKIHPVTGLAACGTGGGRVSYGSRSGEAIELVDGGCTFWLNAEEIAYIGPKSGRWGDEDGNERPQRINIHTRRRELLSETPASFMAAGGNRWQCGIAGPGGSFGSCGEYPGGTISRASTDSRGAAAADGSIVLLDSYQGSGNGFRIGRPDGSVFPTFNPPADRQPGIGAGAPDRYHMTLIDANRAIWPAAGAWGTFGITPAPLWLPGSLRASWVELEGLAYLVHWLEGVGLVARRVDSSRGKVLARVDREYHYDAIAWNGGIRIAWATIDGEPPGSLVIEEWDGSSDLEELAPPIEPPKPIRVAIVAAPSSGVVPLTVRGEATITNGPATSIAWRWRPRGDLDWRIAVVNPGSDPDHSFRFDVAGEYEISAAAEGPNGRAASALEHVTATNAIEPPQPPQPRKLSKGLTMEIDGKVVRLRGAGLRTIAPDAPGTGIWGGSGDPDLKDWRGVLYVADGDGANRYRAKKIPGERYLFTNVDHNCLAGADGGQYSTGLDRQGYHKPTGNTDAGDLEQWRVYEGNEIGSMQAQIEQVSDDKHPAGAGKKIVVFVLTVELE